MKGLLARKRRCACLTIAVLLASRAGLGAPEVTIERDGPWSDRISITPPESPPGWLQPSISSQPSRSAIEEEYEARRNRLRAEAESLGDESPELLPAITVMADWFEVAYQWDAARALDRRAVRIVEDAYGADDPRVAQPLTQLARTYVAQRYLHPEGRQALERVVKLYDSRPGSEAALAEALIALGDWLMLTHHADPALAIYTRAWHLLSVTSGGWSDVSRHRLGQPRRLRYDPPPPEPTPLPEDFPNCTVVELTITPRGEAESIAVLETSHSRKKATQLRRVVRQSVYRPAFPYGEPVARTVRAKHCSRIP